MKTSVVSLKNNDFCYWITDKYIYLMLFVFPLFLGFDGYVHLTVSKYIFFVSATVIWLILIIIGCICNSYPTVWYKFGYAKLFMLLFLISTCVSALFSPFKSSILLGSGRFNGLLTGLLYFSIFFGISRFAKPKPGHIYSFAISAGLCCIVAVVQLLGYNALKFFPSDYTYYDGGTKYMGEFLGTIGNADLFSAFLCLVLPLSSIYYIVSSKRQHALLPFVLLFSFCIFACRVSAGKLAVIACVLIAAPLVITNGKRLRRALELSAVVCLGIFAAISLSAVNSGDGIVISFAITMKSLFTLALGSLLIIIRYTLNKREFKPKTLPRFFLVISVLTVLSGIFVVYFWSGTKGTIYEFSRLLHGELNDNFGSSRILIWRKTLELVPERLLFGGGPGTLALRLDVNFSRFVEETGKTLSCMVDNAHNEYLGILVDTGLLSLIFFVAAQAASFIYAIKARHKTELVLPLICCLLCYWMQAFFGLGLVIVAPFMWLLWGMLLAAVTPKPQHPAQQSSDPSELP